MAVQVGITALQARQLLDLARKSNSRAKVRTFEMTGKQHGGAAFLIGILNDRQAQIKPFHHGGKVETVSLGSLRLWEGGNDFDIKAIKEAKVLPQAQTPVIQTPIAAENVQHANRFVIFSKSNKAVWGGDRVKWTADFNRAFRWQANENYVSSVVLKRLQSQEPSGDAELLNEPAAYEALLALNPRKTPLINSPIQTSPLPEPAKLAEGEQPASPQYEEDDFLDLDSIFNSQASALRDAENARRDAVEEYKTAKLHFDLIKQRLAILDANVVKFGGRSGLKSAPATGRATSAGKRVFIRGRIQKILLKSSRLDSQSIHERLLADLPDLDKEKTYQSLSAMKSDGLAERDSNGGYALTPKGRTFTPLAE